MSEVVASFDAVYEREYPGLVRLAHLLTGSNEVGEDVVQEAFAAALRRWDTLANPPGYIRTTVVNGCRSVHRRRGTEQRLGHSAASPGSVDPHAGDDVDGDGALWQALCVLPFRQRAVVVLRFYEDRTTDDIAAVLRCRSGTVRSLLSRALATLREKVER